MNFMVYILNTGTVKSVHTYCRLCATNQVPHLYVLSGYGVIFREDGKRGGKGVRSSVSEYFWDVSFVSIPLLQHMMV